ncbi:hypothetical protein F383_34298 [Gossypium arboreum]|jgi:hypothetical protein
MSLR